MRICSTDNGDATQGLMEFGSVLRLGLLKTATVCVDTYDQQIGEIASRFDYLLVRRKLSCDARVATTSRHCSDIALKFLVCNNAPNQVRNQLLVRAILSEKVDSEWQ